MNIAVYDSPKILENIGDVSQHTSIEDKLENEQKNFKTIFDTAPVGMLVVNECIIIKNLNHSLLKIIGKEYDKVIGKRIGEGLGCVNSITNGGCGLSERCRFCKLSEHLTNIIEKDEACLGIEFQYELLVDNKVLSKWLRINMEKMILEGRKSYLLVIDDISERKIAEEGLRRYQLLSENANDIILFADINGHVIEANDAAIRAYGYEKEELLSKSIF